MKSAAGQTLCAVEATTGRPLEPTGAAAGLAGLAGTAPAAGHTVPVSHLLEVGLKIWPVGHGTTSGAVTPGEQT